MRNLTKEAEPEILVANATGWRQEWEMNPDSATCRFRYRHPDIKAALKRETAGKCIYCESHIGHNTPGDVEHKVPSSRDRTKHFEWTNLTLACTECNRRKGGYHDNATPFLDPYVDDVEAILVHHGPIVGWLPGHTRAEVTVRRLELNRPSRTALIVRKIEKIEEVHNLLARLATHAPTVLKETLRARLTEMQERHAEYSAMVIAVCRRVQTGEPESAA